MAKSIRIKDDVQYPLQDVARLSTEFIVAVLLWDDPLHCSHQVTQALNDLRPGK